jgi:hypothetical protein
MKYSQNLMRALWAGLALFFSGVACANDTSVGYDNGGLVLTKNEAIEMKSEKLFISPNAIRISYEFYNRTDQDATLDIAFPMPDIANLACDDGDHADPPHKFQDARQWRPRARAEKATGLFEGRGDHPKA